MSEQQEQQEHPVSNHDKNSIFCPEVVNKKRSQLLEGFKIPLWVVLKDPVTPRRCCFCDEVLGLESVRNISLCLNAQHFGDIQIEILCIYCSSSYFLHFRKECASIFDFNNNILGHPPRNEPVLQSDIKHSDNNLADIIIADRNSSVRDIEEKDHVNN